LGTVERPQESVERQRAAPPVERGTARGDLALFHRGLADLCRANVPLPRALRILQGDLEKGDLAREIATMADEIEKGVPLVEAYAARRKYFPPVYGALLELGMAGGGALPEVLEEISIHASARAHIAERLKRTLAYPMVAGLFVLVLGIVLILFVGPSRVTELSQGMAPPAPAEGWSFASGFGLLALAAVAVIALVWVRRPLDDETRPHSLAFRLPLFGRLRLLAAKASFAGTMALLLRRSTPLPTALSLTAAATNDASIRARIEEMARIADGGGNLGDAVQAGDLISPSLSWFLQAAPSERSAAEALDDIASIYRQRLERAADRVAVLAAPVAQMLIGLVVLGFALSYMSSAFQMYSSFELF
jgi:general secretion pathway protein F